MDTPLPAEPRPDPLLKWPADWTVDDIAWVKRQIIGEYLRAEPRPDLREALDPHIRTELIEVAAAMMRGERTCEKGHRAGKSEHIHFDDVHSWGQRIARVAAALATTPPAPEHEHDWDCLKCADMYEAGLVAAAATPPAQPLPTIDVGLLREAFRRHEHEGGDGVECAESIAAEYTRARAALESSGGTGDG